MSGQETVVVQPLLGLRVHAIPLFFKNNFFYRTQDIGRVCKCHKKINASTTFCYLFHSSLTKQCFHLQMNAVPNGSNQIVIGLPASTPKRYSRACFSVQCSCICILHCVARTRGNSGLFGLFGIEGSFLLKFANCNVLADVDEHELTWLNSHETNFVKHVLQSFGNDQFRKTYFNCF